MPPISNSSDSSFREKNSRSAYSPLGDEYLSSSPKYNLLYEAFGWEVPTYIHCSPVMRDQHNKMSKRHGDPSYEDLLEQGFLSEAGEVVGGQAVGLEQHLIVQGAVFHGDVPKDRVGKGSLPAGGNFLANHVGH